MRPVFIKEKTTPQSGQKNQSINNDTPPPPPLITYALKGFTTRVNTQPKTEQHIKCQEQEIALTNGAIGIAKDNCVNKV